ncbi:HAD family hydrolase [Streptomyces luteolus]|uniref:HAD family hydrolase n=1 Tax=Streptomyces luteolus TaxID=3043615 RepID=A0ABT6SY16_9ACTN|nr:HAD family hydrolase [Streptomyces sp. B-S-A12]MDI3420491.1 HAD family hydrolase [Streptomyces sp. B-S-A12]
MGPAGPAGAAATSWDAATARDADTARVVTVGSMKAGAAAQAAAQRDALAAAAEPGTFPYKLIATDLDGTLLRSDETISPRTRAALETACGLGAAHIVVTGRAVPWTRHILDDLGYEGIAVCGQGAQVYHAGEHRLLTSVTLDRQLAGLALAKLEAEIGPLALAASRDGVDGEVLVGPGYRVQEGPLPVVEFTDSADLWSAPLNKLYVQHPGLSDDALAEVARRIAGDLVGVTMAGPGIVELLPLGLSKATGLSLAARRLGAKAKDTIAFGDMPNDVPMFGWAAHSVAMANAHDELKAVADEVTASNEDDGIALVLERLLADRGSFGGPGS